MRFKYLMAFLLHVQYLPVQAKGLNIYTYVQSTLDYLQFGLTFLLKIDSRQLFWQMGWHFSEIYALNTYMHSVNSWQFAVQTVQYTWVEN